MCITIYTVLFSPTLPLVEYFGEEAQPFGGEASPLPPPVDRTLQASYIVVLNYSEQV